MSTTDNEFKEKRETAMAVLPCQLKHKAQINNEALAAISVVILDADTSLVDEIAKAVVVAIARNQIPHIEIKY